MPAQVNRIGGEFLVNTAIAGNQYDQQSTALANGGFVVTWRDFSQGVGGAGGDSSGFAVKAQLFDASGARLGSEIRVNTATAGDQYEQKVTALSNGGFVVTWDDASHGVGGATGDNSGQAVKAQVFSANGTPVGSEIRVNTVTADNQYAPEIVALSGGAFAVTWWSSHGDSSVDRLDVKGQLFAADGTRVGGEFLVNTATAQDQYAHKMTALSNGGFVVTWWDESHGVGGATGDSSGSAVKAQLFNAAGAPVGGEILVNTVTASNQDGPEITALSGGGFVVTWRDASQGFTAASTLTPDYDVRAQIFSATGAHVGGEILVNTATFGAEQNQKITALTNGGFVVTWSDESHGVGGAGGDSSSFAIKAQVFDAGGAHVGSEILVNTASAGNQNAPQITALSNGDFVVTWDDDSRGIGGAGGDADSYAIKAQVFDANGTRIGSEILVNTDTAGAQQSSHVTELPGGRFAVTWTSGDGNSIGVKAQIFSVSDAPTPPSEIYLGPPHLPDGTSTAGGGVASSGGSSAAGLPTGLSQPGLSIASNTVADGHADSLGQNIVATVMDGGAPAGIASQTSPVSQVESAPPGLPDGFAGHFDHGWIV